MTRVDSGRRALLVALIGAAVGGTLTTTSSAALPSADKFATAIRKARDIVAISQSGDVDQDTINQQFDSMLKFLLDNFRGEPDVGRIQQMLAQPRATLEPLSEQDLVSLSEDLIPFAIMRELVRLHRISFDTRVVGNYDRFVVRYAPAMLGVSAVMIS